LLGPQHLWVAGLGELTNETVRQSGEASFHASCTAGPCAAFDGGVPDHGIGMLISGEGLLSLQCPGSGDVFEVQSEANICGPVASVRFLRTELPSGIALDPLGIVGSQLLIAASKLMLHLRGATRSCRCQMTAAP
jgi:hypothetical protein